jgi:WD40 repeat protein
MTTTADKRTHVSLPPPEPVFVLRGHETTVNCVCFGIKPAAAATVTLTTELKASSGADAMNSLISKKRDLVLFSGDASGMLHVWDMESRRLLSKIQAHESKGGVLTLRYCTNTRLVISHGKDGTVKIWNPQDLIYDSNVKPIHTMRTDSYTFCKSHILEASSDQTVVAMNCKARTLLVTPAEEQQDLMLWDCDRGKLLNHITCIIPSHYAPTHQSESSDSLSAPSLSDGAGAKLQLGMCMAVQFAPENMCVAIGAPLVFAGFENGVIALLNANTSRVIDAIHVSDQAIMTLAVRPMSRKKMKQVQCHTSSTTQTGDYIDHKKQSNHVWCDVVVGTSEDYVTLVHAKTIPNSSRAPESESDSDSHSTEANIAPGPGSGGLIKLSISSTHKLTGKGVAEITSRADRKIFASAGWDHRIRIFAWQQSQTEAQTQCRPLAILKFHSEAVQSVAFGIGSSRSLQYLASASKDNRIAIWKVYPIKK